MPKELKKKEVRFVITKKMIGGRWQWMVSIRSKNNQKLGPSEYYRQKQSCHNYINIFKAHMGKYAVIVDKSND